MFWILLIISIVFLCLALHNSIGNVVEINKLLSVDSEIERQSNYYMLVEKWGTWPIIEEGKGVMAISFINIPNALFSGLMVTFAALTIIFFLLAIILGKILLPMLGNMYKNNNDELVDITTLRTMEQVNELSGKKDKNKKVKKEWF